MARIVEEYEIVIAQAGDYAQQFLGVIQQKTVEEGLALDFKAFRKDRSGEEVILRSPLPQIKSTSMNFEVYASRQGRALQCGWQVLVNPVGDLLKSGWTLSGGLGTGIDFTVAGAKDEKTISGLCRAFDGLVFKVVAQQLSEAVSWNRSNGREGFLGVE